MSTKHKFVAALWILLLSLPAIGGPIDTPQKKSPSKHHVKMIPARHNAGRPNHP
jgi:hypothetical protein